MDGRLFQLNKRILERLDHQWTISEMADYVKLSAPHFQKLFKIQFKIPPITYLRDLRLEKARQMLEQSFQQINQIGRQVGITNDSHFTRDFKKKFGVTPTDYRKQHWEKIQAVMQNRQK